MDAVTRLLHHRLAVRLSQLTIGVVFLVSGLAKIGDLSSFALQVHNFRMFPIWSENLAAMTLPWIELAAAMSLLLLLRERGGAVLSAVLMAVFIVAVAVAMFRGLDIECGCFGTGDSSRVGLQKLGENLVLLAVSCVAALKADR